MPDQSKIDPETLEGLIEQWFFEAFHGSIVARTTDVWNAVHAAKEDLQQRLRELMGEAPTA